MPLGSSQTTRSGGCSTGKPDGVYGPSTQNAVEQFQASQGLTEDGIFRLLVTGGSQGAGILSTVVPDALVHLECAVTQQVVAGDHLVVFGQVHQICRRAGTPLTFLSGRFGDLAVRGDEPEQWFF